MTHDEYYHEHLAEHLDARGDLAPPWEEFPTYERYTIGWRMGSGESWLGFFGLFLDKHLPTDFQTRLAFLQRHAKAPYTWSDWVYDVLYPDAPADDDDDDDDDDGEKARQRKNERREKLIEMGLVESDVAYFTWRAKQDSIHWPWEDSETPEDAARYWTRDLWFWSRHLDELRRENKIPSFDAPEAWREIAEIIRSGKTMPVEPGAGLLSLVRSCAAGMVIAPWQAGLQPSDFKDSFEMDMGYADAFRLWGMSVFDDQPMIDRYTKTTEISEAWAEWMREQFSMD